MHGPLNDPQTSRFDRLTVAVFLLILSVPPMLLFRSGVEQQVRETERRQVAALPSLDFKDGRIFPKTESLRQFPRKFEAWFNDHLGLRSSFIGLFNLAKVSGLTCGDVAQLSVGGGTNSSVLVGRDGWLFYTGERVIDDYRCTSPLTAEELANWRRVLEARSRWLRERGIRYVVFVAPNKHSIYGEFLPRAINRVGRQSRLDQLVEELASTGDVEFVDLRPTLIAEKVHHQTYHKTDTHWNEFGAYLGYRRVMNVLAETIPQARPLPLSAFDISVSEAEGDYLATLLHSPIPLRESLVRLAPRVPRTAQFTSVPTSAGLPPSTVSTNAAAALPTAVMLGDSFASAFAPYFSEHFQRVHYIGSYEFDPDLVEREQPVVVIQEYVERRLMHLAPKNPASLETIPHLAQPSRATTVR